MTDGNTLLEAFPHPTITAFQEKPTYMNLLRFREKLIENAASVPSSLGSGAHSHSGLILPDAIYFRDTGSNFVRPVFPGVIPSFIQGPWQLQSAKFAPFTLQI